ncbi:MAG: thioredoxin-like domain-containing protein [Pyrinomonadaceae bacterium]
MKRRIFFILTILFLAAGSMNRIKAQDKIHAPELAGARSWLNTDKPLTIAGLKGKVVLLDFWTYGCINCIHIIPDLKKLEAKYGNNLVVIGIHSAKFTNEGDTENIRKIILRYNLEHPIANDADFKIWDAYAIKAYPGLVLIDAESYVRGVWFGEGQFGEIDKMIAESVADARKKGLLNEEPLKLALEKAKVGDLPLAFPGKVLADAKTNRLFISDSNHNRIVVTDLNGKLLETIGSGKNALTDGNFQTASFYHPQGLFLNGENLYVADTENHAIRKINLTTKKVETISGDGKQAAFRSVGGNAKTSELSSPWDLVKLGDALYIAMAGTHQIWKLDLAKNTVAPFAGTGAEARRDGKLDEAAFAQSSGITTDGKNLFIADAESNVIRKIDLQTGTVETLVGGDLCDFGDKDGAGDDVRLQHPLGITLADGKIFITDTYNHKIKTLDTKNKTVKTFLGTGKSGQTDGVVNATFYEPAGLSAAHGKLYIADTDNQAIRVVDLQNKQVSTLKIEGLTAPKSTENEQAAVSPNLKKNKSEVKEVSADSQNSLTFQINLPDGFHLNKDAPNRFEINGENVKVATAPQKFSTLPLVIPFQTNGAGDANLTAKLTIYYCREDNTGVCLIKTLAWQIPLKVSTDNRAQTKIDLTENIR